MLILPPEHLPNILDSFAMRLPAVFSAVTLTAAAHMQPTFFSIKCLGGLFIYLFICFDKSCSSISYQRAKQHKRGQSKGKHDLKKVGRKVFSRRELQKYHGEWLSNHP